MIRFHLDEHIDHAITRGLRGRGIDVTTATDADLLGAPDEAHLDFAQREQRVLVTNDADFLRITHENDAHAGIVFCVSATHTIGTVVRHLCLMHDCHAAEMMTGRIEFL